MIRSKIEGLLGFFSSSFWICVTNSVGGKRMGIFGDGIDARSVCAGEIWTVRWMLGVGSEPLEVSWIRIGSVLLLSCGLDSSALIRPGIWSLECSEKRQFRCFGYFCFCSQPPHSVEFRINCTIQRVECTLFPFTPSLRKYNS